MRIRQKATTRRSRRPFARATSKWRCSSLSRVFPAVTVAAIVCALLLMPGRYRLLPWWSDLVIGAAFVVAILAGKRTVVLGLVALVAVLEVGVLSRLLIDMSTRPAGISALALLSTAVGVW